LTLITRHHGKAGCEGFRLIQIDSSEGGEVHLPG
jgi:hypothetical protein